VQEVRAHLGGEEMTSSEKIAAMDTLTYKYLGRFLGMAEMIEDNESVRPLDFVLILEEYRSEHAKLKAEVTNG
jgi:hypothetical protein